MNETIDTVFAAAMTLSADERTALTERLVHLLGSERLHEVLDRRWADHVANPEDSLTWDEAETLARSHLRK